MSASEGDHRPAAAGAKFGTRGGYRNRAVRIDQHARSGVSLGDRLHPAGVVDPGGGKQAARGVPYLVILGQTSALAKEPHRLAYRRAITTLQLEQQAFEIARYLNVHARAQALLNRDNLH